MTDTTATSNGLVDVAKATLVQQIQETNTLVSQVLAATSDVGNLVADIRDDPNTQDETLKAFQAWLEKINAAVNEKTAEMDEYVKANLMPKAEDIDVDALKAKIDENRKVIRQGLSWLGSLPGADISDVPDLKSLRGGSSSASTGDGPKRPRVNDILVNGESIAKDVKNAKTGKVERKANFTFAAAYISGKTGAKVETSDLQAAAFAAAKTDDLKTLNGEPFEFYFESGEGDKRQNFSVKVYPRSSDSAPAPKTESATQETSGTEGSQSE